MRRWVRYNRYIDNYNNWFLLLMVIEAGTLAEAFGERRKKWENGNRFCARRLYRY